ncbi:hypothetical protein [Peribacillus sp. Hz7]|uniref:hypothetical protein n=1 Tax=Peribacillus sp. Hz7 TaxID=3344873 RepID=UPI0035CA7EE2
MSETKISYQMNGFTYILETYRDFLRITRDDKVIHVQYKKIKNPNDIGLKGINDIIGNFASYIEFCETEKPFRYCAFTDDEWARKTHVHCTIHYTLSNGQDFMDERHADTVNGEMRSADSTITKYECFIKNCSKEELKKSVKVVPWTREQLIDHLNAEAILKNSLKKK